MQPCRECDTLLAQLNTSPKTCTPWTFFACMIHDNENHQRFFEQEPKLDTEDWRKDQTRNGCILAQWTHLYLYLKNQPLATKFKLSILTQFETILPWKWNAWTVCHDIVNSWLKDNLPLTEPWTTHIVDLWKGHITILEFRKACQTIA